MTRTRGISWGPIVRPLVVVALMLIVAVIFRGSVVMTVALVVGLLAFAFVVIAVLTQLPVHRARDKD